MPMNGSRTQPTRGSITPPLPSPPISAPVSRISGHDIRLADGRAVNRHAESVARSSRTRDVDMFTTTGPAFLPEPVLHGQRQRQFFAQTGSGFVDQGQAVGVRVEHEAGRRAGFLHLTGDRAEMGRDRFRFVDEDAVHLAAERLDDAPNVPQKVHPGLAAGAAVGVQEHVELAPPQAIDVEQIHHRVAVRPKRVVTWCRTPTLSQSAPGNRPTA